MVFRIALVIVVYHNERFECYENDFHSDYDDI
jgi:hypothetical protein